MGLIQSLYIHIKISGMRDVGSTYLEPKEENVSPVERLHFPASHEIRLIGRESNLVPSGPGLGQPGVLHDGDVEGGGIGILFASVVGRKKTEKDEIVKKKF